MASEQEYLEKMDTGTLEVLLAREVYGRNRFCIATVYTICAILARREPVRGTARDLFLEFAGRYADCREL